MLLPAACHRRDTVRAPALGPQTACAYSRANTSAHIMAIGRVVPWSSWEEWHAVYRDLFTDSTLRKNTALYQVPSIAKQTQRL